MFGLFLLRKVLEDVHVRVGSSNSQVIDSSDDLVDCYKEDTRHLLTNMWAITSMSFVLGMMERRQSTVVALVNKDMKGERALQKAVLYEHEIPTLGVAAYGLGYWSPQVLLIDMQGTCSQTSPALQRQLLSRLGAWVKAKQEQHWRLQDFVRRSRLHWRCLDCANAETCNLDSALAQQVTQLVEASYRGCSSLKSSCWVVFKVVEYATFNLGGTVVTIVPNVGTWLRNPGPITPKIVGFI